MSELKYILSDAGILSPDIDITDTLVKIKHNHVVNIPEIENIQIDLDGFNDELKNLTTSEIQQLENIDSNIISNTKWGHLANMNQNVSTTSNTIFNQLIISDKGSNVNQTTSISTSVTSNTQIGQITTVSATIILSGSSTFTVNCSFCTSNSIVILSPISYSGTGGNPTYFVSATNNGSFDITIRNFNTLVALSGSHIIKYIIF